MLTNYSHSLALGPPPTSPRGSVERRVPLRPEGDDLGLPVFGASGLGFKGLRV